jgi:protein O-GlcNAc transferase
MSFSTTADLLREAIALQRRGAVAEAAARYTEVLRADPKNADAYYYLGMMSCQAGRFEEGVELARKALTHDQYHANAHILLGRALGTLGQHAEALISLQQAISLAPEIAAGHSHLADVLSDLGRKAEAIHSYDRALGLKPDCIEDWFNRGLALHAVGRLEEALTSFQRVVAAKPEVARAHLETSNVLWRLHQYGEALESVDRALARDTGLGEAWHSRGNILHDLRQYDGALAAYDKALALKPDLVEAWLGRGKALRECQRYEEALTAYEKALARKPRLAEAWLGRGNVFLRWKRYEEASAAYDKALELKSDFAEAWYGGAQAALHLAQYHQAFLRYHKALTLDPNLEYVEGLLLEMKLYLCDWTELETETAQLLTRVKEGKAVSVPFALLPLPSTAAEQLQCAVRYTKDLRTYPPVWLGETYAHDRIRVAYLSADFRNHPVAYLTAGLFEHHDKSRFEITGISMGPADNSPLRRRLEGAFEDFIDAKDKTEADIANLIRNREIDIAVDLMGHTLNSQLSILARRPAPIQVHYIGYAGTSGANYIDYILADPTVIPEEHCPFFTEQVVWLPDGYLASDNRRAISAYTPTHRECGLPEDGFVFCSFNNSYKIAPKVFELWMRLLRATPKSVLWLSQANASAMANLRREAERHGIWSQRLIFAPKVADNADHLARQRQADLFLDTLPYNAHTTASDALWAGLPVLTCIGETFAGRVAASLLRAIGLPELVTRSLEEYEALALKLTQEPGFLAAIKSKLAENRKTYPLFDTARFTRAIEAAYVIMWERHQRGDAPEAFSVPAFKFGNGLTPGASGKPQ